MAFPRRLCTYIHTHTSGVVNTAPRATPRERERRASGRAAWDDILNNFITRSARRELAISWQGNNDLSGMVEANRFAKSRKWRTLASVYNHRRSLFYTVRSPAFYTPSAPPPPRPPSGPLSFLLRVSVSSLPFFIPIKSLEASRRGCERRLVTFPNGPLFLSYTYARARERDARHTYTDASHPRAYTTQVDGARTRGHAAFSPFLPPLLHYLFRAGS